MSNSMQMVPVQDIERMAGAVAKSGLFGVKTQEQAFALMLVAQAEGMHPAIAARDYHVINGRPSLRADAMLARFQQAGGKVEWKKYSDEECVGVFSHPSGGSVEIVWTLQMATKAGLTNNPTWKKFSRAMLRARCISEGIRTVFPGVVSGFYAPEEVIDFDTPMASPKDITPAPEPVAKPVSMPEKVKQAAAKVSGKPRKPDLTVIEGEATTISGDPNEGNLDDVAAFQNHKPAKEQVDKMLAAFQSQLSMTQQQVEKECNFGPVAEWTIEQIDEAREVFKALKIERQNMAAIQQGDEV